MNLAAHVRTAARMLRRHRLPGIVNATGLALGLGVFILVAAYASDEWSFDRFHEHADRLYRLAGEYTDATETAAYARVPPAVVPTLVRDVPDVETGVRLQRATLAVRAGDEVRYETDLFYADPSFFRVFTFPLVYGNPETALRAPGGIVLTEETAVRYFGRSDVVGRTLVVTDSVALTVTGVARDVPARSHLQFAGLISFSTFERSRPDIDFDALWTWGTFYSYVLLAPGSDPAAAQSRITAAIDARLGTRQDDGIRFSARLQPVTRIRLYSELRQEVGPVGQAGYLAVFCLIGLGVLAIAGINFVNLATARATVRAREVGVRKANGASWAQLVMQFMTEAAATGAIAIVLALGFAATALPAFNRVAGKSLVTGDLIAGPLFGMTVAVGLLTACLAGIYPSLHLARFRPVAALRPMGSVSVDGRRHRQLLVVVQFAASIFLIGGTLVALRQIDHLRRTNPGFDRDQIAVLPFHWDDVVQGRFEVLRSELLAIPGVTAVTASGDVPGRMFTSMSVWGEGMPEGTSLGANALIVDPDFAETYGLEVVAGRDFSRDHPSDWDDAFMLNEAGARMLGWSPREAVGRQFDMNGPGTVIGVFRDFHYEGLQTAIEPIALAMWPSWFGYVSVRLEAGVPPGIVDAISSTWRQVVPERPFEYFFLDDDFDHQYRTEARFGSLLLALAVLAVVIACLGLYGLTAFVTERRTREVGIRKVLGARPSGLVMLLARDFLLLVGIAFLIAAPLTWLAAERWLSSFASRIDMPFWLLPVAGMLAVAASVLPTAVHTIRVARTDPVRSLRYE